MPTTGVAFARIERESCWIGECRGSATAAAVGGTQIWSYSLKTRENLSASFPSNKSWVILRGSSSGTGRDMKSWCGLCAADEVPRAVWMSCRCWEPQERLCWGKQCSLHLSVVQGGLCSDPCSSQTSQLRDLLLLEQELRVSGLCQHPTGFAALESIEGNFAES